eukprot:3006436-Prymnesium_polylepis.1
MAGIQRFQSTHLSDLRCSLPAMHDAMITPDLTWSPLLDRSIDSVGLVPRSSSMGRGWPSTLHKATPFRLGKTIPAGIHVGHVG